MSRPTSFRLPDELLQRLDAEAKANSESVTSLVASLLDEGLKTRRFPGIVYRPGPAGRRAGLLGGPDVWEVVRAVQRASGEGERRLTRVATETNLPLPRVRLAVDFYTAHPEEIDERIALDEQEATRIRSLIDRREKLMSS